ncbi:Acyltransferase AGPAT5, partial [Operophtera brumata]
MWGTLLLFFVFLALSYLVQNIVKREPNPVQFHSKFVIVYFVISVTAAVLWPVFLLRPRDVRNSNIGTRIIKNIVLRIQDIKWVLRNGHILSEERGAVIVSNHQLSLDILGMFNIWDEVGKMAAIAKKQLFYVFPFGLTAYLAGVVFIDRTNPKAAYAQLKETSEVMVKNKDYTKLLPFKKGAFTIAVAAQVPIIPVIFSPYYFPIPTVGLTNEDVPELIAKVHDKMSAAYKELSKEVL